LGIISYWEKAINHDRHPDLLFNTEKTARARNKVNEAEEKRYTVNFWLTFKV
jgi:hypothetical protein